MERENLIKYGFTGTQLGMTEAQKASVKTLFIGVHEVHLGDCIGADKDAHHIACIVGAKTIGHVPDIKNKRAYCIYDEERKPLPYLDRNRNIVDESDVLVATPKSRDEETRSGTWYTIRYARKQGKRIYIVFPDGTISNLLKRKQ